jgi:hypothetical protein
MIAGRAALDLLKDQVRLFDSGINAVNTTALALA